MQTTAVDIVNAAVGALGDLAITKRMTAFTREGCGSSTVLAAAFDFYGLAKELMLGALDWPSARTLAALTAGAAAPLDETWSYKYARPPDCLILRKVVDTAGGEWPWEQINEPRTEGGQTFYDPWIYTNLVDARARYTIDVPEHRYGPGMAELHSLYLAQKLAMTVTARSQVRAGLVQELHARAERLCLALGAKEGYVEDEQGNRQLTDCY